MPKLDFNPRLGPFRFTAGMGVGFWSVLGILGLFVLCCCCGGLGLFTTGN